MILKNRIYIPYIIYVMTWDVYPVFLFLFIGIADLQLFSDLSGILLAGRYLIGR